MTLLDCCLAIVEPGYEAPRARAPYEETMPRVKPAHDLCKTCGQDERQIGRSECSWCIAESPGGAAERARANASAAARHRALREAVAAEKLAAMTPAERAKREAVADKRAKSAARMRKTRERRREAKTCACGRPMPCLRRLCR